MASDLFWGPFLNEQGRDSEEETAFLGYLSSHGIAGGAEADVLQVAYGEFQTWMTASYAEDASASETRAAAAKVAPAEAPALPPVPKSSHADPVLHQKPATAATRPPGQRPPEGPTTEPKAATAAAASPATSSAPSSRRSLSSSDA